MRPSHPNKDCANRPRSLKKRILFGLLALLGVYLVVEILALAAYVLSQGHAFSFAGVQAERRALSTAETDGVGDPKQGNESVALARVANNSLHPYVGYVRTPTTKNTDSLAAQLGYHDSNPIRKRREGTVIIGVVGGSVAKGFPRYGTETLVDRLKSSPDFANKNIEIVHLAMGGYKQPQQFMTVGYLLTLGAEFDIILNIDGFNEVALHAAENAKTRTFVAYPRLWHFQTSDSRHVQASEYGYLRHRQRELAHTFSGAGLRHSVSCNLVWTLRNRWLGQEIYAAHQALLDQDASGFSYESTGPSLHYPDENAMMQDLVDIWKQSSLQLDHLCRANNIDYFQFLQPNQYLPESKPLTPAERDAAYRENHPYRRGVEIGYPLLRAEGADLVRQGVRFTDLTQAFATESEPLYIDTCCHFNARGHEILAEQIVRVVLSAPASQDRADESGSTRLPAK